LLLDEKAPSTFLPITDGLTIIQNGPIDEITVEQVSQAVAERLAVASNSVSGGHHF